MYRRRKVLIPALVLSGAVALGGALSYGAGQAAAHAAHAGRAPAEEVMKYRSCPNETPSADPSPCPSPS